MGKSKKRKAETSPDGSQSQSAKRALLDNQQPSQTNARTPTSLHVRDLAQSVNKELLALHFADCPNFKSAYIPPNQSKENRYGFVNFADANSAVAAIQSHHKSVLRGRRIHVVLQQTRMKKANAGSDKVIKSNGDIPNMQAVTADVSNLENQSVKAAGNERTDSDFMHLPPQNFAQGIKNDAIAFLELRDRIKANYPEENPKEQTHRYENRFLLWLDQLFKTISTNRSLITSPELLAFQPWDDEEAPVTRARDITLRSINQVYENLRQLKDLSQAYPLVFEALPDSILTTMDAMLPLRRYSTIRAGTGLAGAEDLEELFNFIHEDIPSLHSEYLMWRAPRWSG